MHEKILPKNSPPTKKRIHIQTSKAIFHFRAFLLCRTNELSHNGSEALTSFYAITSDDIHNPSLAKQNNNIQIFGFSVRFGSVPSFNSGVGDVNGWNAFGDDGVNPSANMKKSQLNQRCTLFRHPLDPSRWMERFPKGLVSSHILRIQCNRHGEK